MGTCHRDAREVFCHEWVDRTMCNTACIPCHLLPAQNVWREREAGWTLFCLPQPHLRLFPTPACSSLCHGIGRRTPQYATTGVGGDATPPPAPLLSAALILPAPGGAGLCSSSLPILPACLPGGEGAGTHCCQWGGRW